MKTFETGKAYVHGWIGDSELFTTWTVLTRTAKTVTITDGYETRKCRIFEYDGTECVRPFGTYSMCPTLRAEKVVA